MKITQYSSLIDAVGRRLILDPSTDWVDPPRGEVKDKLPLWSAITHDGSAKAANIREISALVLDIDAPMELEDGFARIGQALAGASWHAHTSFRATPEAAKYRVLVELDQVIKYADYDLLWHFAKRRMASQGIAIDPTGKSCAHRWFVAARPPSGFYVYRNTNAAPLCVAQACAYEAAVRLNATMNAPRAVMAAKAANEDKITTMIRRMSTAGAGERHEVLFRAALRLTALGRPLGEIEAALGRAALQSMGSNRRGEIERTIRDAYKKGNK